MKARPILFSGEMVRALLDGRKTQTRRVIKPQPPEECSIHYMLGAESWLPKEKQSRLRHTWEAWGGKLFAYKPDGHLCGLHEAVFPYGHPGDLLWVRETFCEPDYATVVYAADWTDADLRRAATIRKQNPDLAKAYPQGRWKPSVHMKRKHSRLTLRITDVRAERVQDITPEDAAREGARFSYTPEEDASETGGYFGDVPWFPDLWNTLNAKRGYGWDVNPWVWVLTFEVIQKNVDAI